MLSLLLKKPRKYFCTAELCEKVIKTRNDLDRSVLWLCELFLKTANPFFVKPFKSKIVAQNCELRGIALWSWYLTLGGVVSVSIPVQR